MIVPTEFPEASQVLGIGGVGRRTGKGASREGGSAHAPDGFDHRLLGMGRNRHGRCGRCHRDWGQRCHRHGRGGIRHYRGTRNHWPEPGKPVVKANQFLAPGDQSGVMPLPVPEPATDRVRDQCPGPLGLADTTVEGLVRSGTVVDRVPELVGGHATRVFRTDIGCREGRGGPPARVVAPERLPGNRSGDEVSMSGVGCGSDGNGRVRFLWGNHCRDTYCRGDRCQCSGLRLAVGQFGPVVFFLRGKAGEHPPDRSPAR